MHNIHLIKIINYYIIIIHLYPFSNIEKRKLWIRPESAEYFIVYSLLYPFFTLLTAAAIYGYFKIGDIILLICGIVLMFGLLYGNVLTMKQGTTKVKFKQEKNAI